MTRSSWLGNKDEKFYLSAIVMARHRELLQCWSPRSNYHSNKKCNSFQTGGRDAMRRECKVRSAIWSNVLEAAEFGMLRAIMWLPFKVSRWWELVWRRSPHAHTRCCWSYSFRLTSSRWRLNPQQICSSRKSFTKQIDSAVSRHILTSQSALCSS